MFHAYVQNTSLNRISYYGLGQSTTTSHTLFGMSEAIVGGNVVWPVTGRLNMSLLGEANGRFSSIRASHQTGETSIEQTNTRSIRTRLIHSAGLRSIRLREFASVPAWRTGTSAWTTQRAFRNGWRATQLTRFDAFKADLSHQFPLYRSTRSLLPREYNGPDTCSSDPNSLGCPPVSRNLEGSFGCAGFSTPPPTRRREA